MTLPYSKALRKRGSFLYTIHLLFKEETEIGKSKSFTSHQGKFIYT